MNDVFRSPRVIDPSLAIAKGHTFEAFVGASLIAKSHISVLKKSSETSTTWSFYFHGGVSQENISMLLRVRMKDSFREKLGKELDRYIQHAVGVVFLKRYCPGFVMSDPEASV